MSENESYTQLQMVWPEQLLDAPPVVRLPPGYTLRTYRRGDEARFYEVMALAGCVERARLLTRYAAAVNPDKPHFRTKTFATAKPKCFASDAESL